MWVEIKSVNYQDLLAPSFRAHEWARRHASNVQGLGRGYLHASRRTTERDVRFAFALVNRALANPRLRPCQGYRVMIVVPENPTHDRFATIHANGTGEKFVFISCLNKDGVAGIPVHHDEVEWLNKATIEIDEAAKEVDALDLMWSDDKVRLILEICPSEKPFEMLGTGALEGAIHVPNVKRFRQDAKEANRQFRNAVRVRDVPCVLMIYHDQAYISDKRTFLSAFYGDMMVPFDRNSDSSPREVHFGGNGIWGRTKNCTTSAACYLPGQGEPLLLYNHWARRPLPRGIFPFPEWGLVGTRVQQLLDI